MKSSLARVVTFLFVSIVALLLIAAILLINSNQGNSKLNKISSTSQVTQIPTPAKTSPETEADKALMQAENEIQSHIKETDQMLIELDNIDTNPDTKPL